MVGMVIFGVASFIFLLLSIVLYSQIGKAQQLQADAEKALVAIGNAGELNSATVVEIKASEGNGTLIGKMMTEVESLRNKNQSLEAEVSSQGKKLGVAETSLKAQSDAAAQAQTAFGDAVNSKTELEAALRKEVDGLTAKIDAVGAENTRLSKLIDTELAGLNDSSTALFTEKQTELDTLASSLNDREEEVLTLRTTVASLRGTTVESPAVTLPDARVVTQNTSERKVFLDIGHNQNLRLGMAFNVFDADDLVKISDADARGKAIVEIINIEENTSIGRVVQSNTRSHVSNGDVLVNVAYDPNRTFSFHVFGQYDLNYDGKIGLRDHETIEAVVTRSGGRLVDALSFDTDYLVLGFEPGYPAKPADELDLIKMREYRVQLENFQAYQDLLGEANDLGIPVLNQSRFLDLVGYFAR